MGSVRGQEWQGSYHVRARCKDGAGHAAADVAKFGLMILIPLALAANVLITFTVAVLIQRNDPGMADAYGPDTPARRILACVYAAIGAVSLYALMQIVVGQPSVALAVGLVLFPLQIAYKVLTALALGLRHPVVVANLAVCVLLAITLIGAY